MLNKASLACERSGQESAHSCTKNSIYVPVDTLIAFSHNTYIRTYVRTYVLTYLLVKIILISTFDVMWVMFAL